MPEVCVARAAGVDCGGLEPSRTYRLRLAADWLGRAGEAGSVKQRVRQAGTAQRVTLALALLIFQTTFAAFAASAIDWETTRSRLVDPLNSMLHKHWPDELAEDYRNANKDLHFFQTGKVKKQTIYEFPEKTKRVRTQRKIGRNAPCPCGSGRKYKLCCIGKT